MQLFEVHSENKLFSTSLLPFPKTTLMIIIIPKRRLRSACTNEWNPLSALFIEMQSGIICLRKILLKWNCPLCAVYGYKNKCREGNWEKMMKAIIMDNIIMPKAIDNTERNVVKMKWHGKVQQKLSSAVYFLLFSSRSIAFNIFVRFCFNDNGRLHCNSARLALVASHKQWTQSVTDDNFNDKNTKNESTKNETKTITAPSNKKIHNNLKLYQFFLFILKI